MLVDRFGRPLSGDPLTDEQLVELAAAEIRARDAQPLILGPFDPMQGLRLAGLLQLAMRHPAVELNERLIAADIVDAIREYFAGAPTVLELLARGDDAAQDV